MLPEIYSSLTHSVIFQGISNNLKTNSVITRTAAYSKLLLTQLSAITDTVEHQFSGKAWVKCSSFSSYHHVQKPQVYKLVLVLGLTFRA